ncbi:MAG: zinc metallopeptidase [Clostridia bacterium]|nr:zinc metallopeptidase [Clostridia bacterium]
MFEIYEILIFIFLFVPAMAFATYAQIKVQKTFSNYNKVPSKSNITGEQLVEMIAQKEGLDVTIKQGRGHLTDHYNPSKRVVSLSSSTYGHSSVAALGVVAHEMGHAIQHAKGYGPLKLRTLTIRISNLTSWMYLPLIVIGIIINAIIVNSQLGKIFIWVGVGLFALTTLISLITLPVEINASKRAIVLLEELGIMDEEELPQAKSVLSAAALTYVAALLISIVQLLRLIVIAKLND